jgi:aspartate racemase
MRADPSSSASGQTKSPALTTPVRRRDSLGVIGILGGMGPLATVDLMRKIVDATPAQSDQDHVPVIVSSIPQIPDRARAFRGEGDCPLPAMLTSGRRLLNAGAGLIVIACNTAHLWFDDIQRIGLPMLHLVDAALDEAVSAAGSSPALGLLGTDATLASGLYVNRAARTESGRGIRWLLPTALELATLVIPGIAAVKAGDLISGGQLLGKAAQALEQRGAAGLILGCTEIPLVLHATDWDMPLVDPTSALARRVVAWSLEQRRRPVKVWRHD